MEINQLPKKLQETGFKFDYSKLKKCVLKKEVGDNSDNECKRLWETLGIKEA